MAKEAEAKELDLTVQQAAQAQDKASEAEVTLGRRLAEAYTWALVPVQPDPTGPIDFEPVRVEGTGDLVSRTARKLADKGHLYPAYAPSILRTLVLEGPPIEPVGARPCVSGSPVGRPVPLPVPAQASRPRGAAAVC